MREQKLKVAFLYKGGRMARRDDAATEPFPTEMFYGMVQLAASGMAVEALEQPDLGIEGEQNRCWRVLTRLSDVLFGFHAWAVWRMLRPRVLRRMNEFDVLVATTQVLGLGTALLKRLGLIQSNIVFIAMGCLPNGMTPLKRVFMLWLLRRITLAVISRGELDQLRAVSADRLKLRYLPFGIDTSFWQPDVAGGPGDYILSIGNDRHRDYATLVSAWRPEFPKLKIVTRLPVRTKSDNMEVIEGDWNQRLLSDAAIRGLIQGARFVVLPIRQTTQPSGQSACLQAMACGKAVVLSDIMGLWDRNLMRDGENCILVPPGDAEALGRSVQELFDNPAHARVIGRAARRTVAEHLNVDAMARVMRKLCIEEQTPAGAR